MRGIEIFADLADEKDLESRNVLGLLSAAFANQSKKYAS
jgi:hypothetical protein